MKVQKTKTSKPKATSGKSADSAVSIAALGLAELAVDIWRIAARAKKEQASDRILNACERADDRLRSLGVTLDDMLEHYYDENLKVRVLDHEEADEPRRIIECLSPGVFIHNVLIRQAEVITRGDQL